MMNILRRFMPKDAVKESFVKQEETSQDEMKLYYYTEGGKTPRDPNNTKDYILFMDLGSYRTSVLCWPYDSGREDLTNAWKYIVRYEDGKNNASVGFPSAFVNSPKSDERDFRFIPDITQVNIPQKQIVKSAKFAFASQFAAYNGDVPSFKLYIKKVLEKSFEYITAPHQDRPWNDAYVPRIIETRVTVPDLFIENLREGYRKSIVEVCLGLSQSPKWKYLFPSEDEFETMKDSFVTISSDESGSCELYFVNLIKDMPFWNLSHPYDREYNLQDVEFLFAQHKHHTGEQNDLTFAVCHLDVGGLTTDASIVLLKTFKDDDLGITTTLLRKESFSEKRAGEYFKDLYREENQETPKKQNWWESQSFVEKHFLRFISIILDKQFTLFTQWKGEKHIHGFYFLISGRPTKSPVIQDAIRMQISKLFNKEELLILPDHCLFMADYRHVGKNAVGERYAEQIEDFEKLITILGNVYTLYDGYDIKIENHRYYISLDLGRPGTCHEIRPDTDYDLESHEDFEDYRKASLKNNVVHLAFSKHPEGRSVTRFLTAKKIAGQVAYPTLQILEKDEHDRSWIIPSINVINLPDNQQSFDLAWSHPAL